MGRRVTSSHSPPASASTSQLRPRCGDKNTSRLIPLQTAGYISSTLPFSSKLIRAAHSKSADVGCNSLERATTASKTWSWSQFQFLWVTLSSQTHEYNCQASLGCGIGPKYLLSQASITDFAI